MPALPPPWSRRLALHHAGALAVLWSATRIAGALPPDPQARWYRAAEAMKRLAESWGDQAYGAVLVQDGVLVGEGPSRVVRNQDPGAHAEREAIRDAERRLGSSGIVGAVLYSTSRPCSLCEAAAARAGVSRMVYGAALTDAGRPRGDDRTDRAAP